MLAVISARAEVISLNFGAESGSLAPDDLAGLVGGEIGNSLGSTMVGNWNNLSGNSGSNVGNILHFGGAVVDGVAISWTSDNTFSLGDTTLGANASANTIMMKGYLDNASGNTSTITMSGLEAVSGSYSVIVYLDAYNGGQWRRADYTIGATTVTAEDSEWVDFNDGDGNNADGVFQSPVAGGIGNQNWPVTPNNSEGNMIIFSGLTGSSFTLTADPTGTSDGLYRAPINGIQVVGVIPEPATIGLVSLFGGGVILVRRFFRM